MPPNLREKAVRGFFWTFSHQAGKQGIGFVISIVLARMLSPELFGLVGMIGIVTNFGQVIIEGGLTSSLIRSDKVTDADFSTIFFFNLGMSVLIYLASWFAAPAIAAFFRQPVLIPMVRLYCLTFIISAFGAIQATRLTKELDFKTQLLVGLPAVVAGGVVGIVAAWFGAGVWSLVWMHLVQAVFSALHFWLRSAWRPSFVFEGGRLRHHLSFGYKLVLSALLFRGFKNLTQALIGRYFSAAQLGFYTRAQTLKQLPVDSMSMALNKVSYPLFASIQHDNQRLRVAYRSLMQQVLFWTAPLLIFAAVLAEPLFRILLTEKWLPAVPIFQLLCPVGILYPIHAYNLNVLNVKGRSDLFFRLEIIKVFLGSGFIFVGLQFGIFGLLAAEVVFSVAALVINTHYSGRLIDYTLRQQAADVGPTLLLTLVAGAGIWWFDASVSHWSDLARLVVGSGAGALIYLLLANALQLAPFIEVKKMVMNRR